MENSIKLYGIVEGYENISFAIDGFQCVFLFCLEDLFYMHKQIAIIMKELNLICLYRSENIKDITTFTEVR